MSKQLATFEKCEARKANGWLCEYEATEYVKNDGAYLPYRVCGVHKKQGERLLATVGELPGTWGRYGRG